MKLSIFRQFGLKKPEKATTPPKLGFSENFDAYSHKGVPFGCFVDIAHGFKGEFPPPHKTILGSRIGVFKPNVQNIESFILSKLLHRCQPNFAQR